MCAGRLEPGRHRSAQFIPPLDYRIPAEPPIVWDNPEDAPGNFTLHPAGPETDAIFLFRDVRVLTEGCSPHMDPEVGSKASEIVAWMAANPGLVATEPQPVTVGGLRGLQLDLAASGSYTTVCARDQKVYPLGLPILPLLVGAGSGNVSWYVGGDERLRLFVLDLPGGGNLLISVDAIAGDFETLVEISQPVIYSITFDENYY